MKKINTLIFLPLLVVSLVSCQDPNADPNYEAGKELKLVSIEMNQEYGESTLIKYGDYEIVIDSGTSSDAYHVNQTLKSYISDNNIELLIVTHPHGDHVGGMINGAFDNFDISKIVDFGYTYSPSGEGDEISSSYIYNSYVSERTQFVNKGAEYSPITEEIITSPVLDIDKENDLSLTWLKNDYYVDYGSIFPNANVPSDNPNVTSVSFLLTYKYWNMPFLGDGDSTLTETSVMNNHPDILKQSWKKVLLKATHHASSSSMGTNFLEWAHPNSVFVSAAMISSVCVPNQVQLGSGDGKQNHPNSSSVRRIKNALIAQNSTSFYWNAINGDLLMTTDGVSDIAFSGAGRNKDYYIKGTTNISSRVGEKDITFFESDFYSYY
ncbi:MAG: MBL fold metallo-hydrolase [Erysipelotrichaceae bacterium]|jgi:competence protein ComEC|nr:MBL fold metallo-hydrolase [Erysipelotrichaceae bacterium]